jgi:hypothetical protein
MLPTQWSDKGLGILTRGAYRDSHLGSLSSRRQRGTGKKSCAAALPGATLPPGAGSPQRRVGNRAPLTESAVLRRRRAGVTGLILTQDE